MRRVIVLLCAAVLGAVATPEGSLILQLHRCQSCSAALRRTLSDSSANSSASSEKSGTFSMYVTEWESIVVAVSFRMCSSCGRRRGHC